MFTNVISACLDQQYLTSFGIKKLPVRRRVFKFMAHEKNIVNASHF